MSENFIEKNIYYYLAIFLSVSTININCSKRPIYIPDDLKDLENITISTKYQPDQNTKNKSINIPQQNSFFQETALPLEKLADEIYHHGIENTPIQKLSEEINIKDP